MRAMTTLQFRRALIIGGLAATCALCVPALAQQRNVSDADAARLAFEVKPLRPVYMPTGPVLVQFTFINTSDEPVTIPLDRPMGTEIGLPMELALGSADAPTVYLIRHGESAEPVVPEAAAPEDAPRGPRRVQLAPHAVLGGAFDLRACHDGLVYPGTYTLEWRPFQTRLGMASTTFKVEQPQDAVIVTDYGKMFFTLDYEGAPRNVANFVDLAKSDYYRKKTFHCLIPGFVLHGGAPMGDRGAMRPDGKTVPAEFHVAPVTVGTLFMSRKPSDPDSASSQFFIALGNYPDLAEQFTVIGQPYGDETFRTLSKLATVEVNADDQPANPIRINSINLVDPPESRVRHLGGDSAKPEATDAAPAEPKSSN